MEISKKSRVWIYQSNRPFSAQEAQIITASVNAFAGEWQAHGSKLAAKAEVRYHRFIILMVDEEQAGASGCSIDKSVNLMKQIEQETGVSLFDRFNIAYRDEADVKSCNRDEFEALIKAGKINEGTLVFNNLVQTLEELDENWEIPLRNSWHAKVFGDLINSKTPSI